MKRRLVLVVVNVAVLSLLIPATIMGFATPVSLALFVVVPLFLINVLVLSRSKTSSKEQQEAARESISSVAWWVYGGLALACAFLWFAGALGIAQIIAIGFLAWITPIMRQEYKKHELGKRKKNL